ALRRGPGGRGPALPARPRPGRRRRRWPGDPVHAVRRRRRSAPGALAGLRAHPMSLILEALRKSEAERRRGEAPVLHVELPPGLEARMRRRWRPPVAVVVAAALLGAAGGVFWYQAPRAPDGAIPDRTPQDSALPQGGLPGSVATPAGGTPSGEAHAPSPAGTHPEPERYAAGLPAVERILPPPPAVDAGPAPAPPGDGSGHAGTGAVAPTATAQ